MEDNPFVSTYNELSDEQKAKVAEIKEAALVLYQSIKTAFDADPRCTSLAKTNLEQAVMWAVKGVTNPSAGENPPHSRA